MRIFLMSLSLIGLMAAGCHTSKKSDKSNNLKQGSDSDHLAIIETRWKMIVLDGKEVADTDTPGSEIYFTLMEEGQKIAGNTGCNMFNGTYSLEEGNRIGFSRMATTRMACPDVKIKESEVLEVFERADNYTVNGDTLMLNKGDKNRLAVFMKSSLDMEPITEKYWKLVTLEGQEVKMVENQEREAYFILRTDDNRVEGFAGCNTFNGHYTLEDGKRIRFSDMSITLRACPDVEVNESEFMQVFELADNFTLNGDTLMLNVGKRAPLAVFEAVYFD